MRTGLPLVCVVSLVLAGCVGGDRAPVEDSRTDPPKLVELDNDLDGCSEVAITVLRDRLLETLLLPLEEAVAIEVSLVTP